MKLNNGFTVTADDLEDQFFINFDKGGKVGGYVNIHFDNDSIYLTVINGNGDTIRDDAISFNAIEPTGHFGEVEDIL